MRTFQIYLSLLLCLAIPLQGFASVRIAVPQCPMEEAEQFSAMAQDASAMSDDCCGKADTKNNGNCDHDPGGCKAGHACQSLNIQGIALSRSLSFAATASNPRFTPTDSVALHSFDASSVWRPPTRP